jgi:hypothetical protein
MRQLNPCNPSAASFIIVHASLMSPESQKFPRRSFSPAFYASPQHESPPVGTGARKLFRLSEARNPGSHLRPPEFRKCGHSPSHSPCVFQVLAVMTLLSRPCAMMTMYSTWNTLWLARVQTMKGAYGRVEVAIAFAKQLRPRLRRRARPLAFAPLVALVARAPERCRPQHHGWLTPVSEPGTHRNPDRRQDQSHAVR